MAKPQACPATGQYGQYTGDLRLSRYRRCVRARHGHRDDRAYSPADLDQEAETARRVRGRIKAILGGEAVMGKRTGGNPARYVDHLQLLLPRSKKRSLTKQHPALPSKTCRRSSVNWNSVPGARSHGERSARFACRFVSEPSKSCMLRDPRSNMGFFSPVARKGAHCRTWQ